MNRSVLARDLRPLLERTRDALGEIVADGGYLRNENSIAVRRADVRLPELLPGIEDKRLREIVTELADEVRKVFAAGRPRPFRAAMGATVLISQTHDDGSERTLAAARRGEDAARRALERLSAVEAGA